MRGHTVAVSVRSPEYEGPTKPEWIRGTIETPFLDCSACISEDGWVSLAVVNVNEERGYEVDIQGVVEGDVEVYSVSGKSVDAVNTEEAENVGIQEHRGTCEGSFVFKKHSLTMLRWKA